MTRQKRNIRRGRKSRAKGVNPPPLRQDVGAQGMSINIPPRNYLKEHIAGVAPSLRRTLVWAATNKATVAPVLYSEPLVVRLNSPFDPDFAAGGTSATGFAKYMAFYSKAFVIAARIKFRIVGSGSTSSGPPDGYLIRGITITTNTTTLLNAATAIQAGLCDYEITNVNPDRTHHELGVDVAKFVNKPDILDDNQYFCTSAADPAQLIVAHCWVDASNNAANTQHFAYVVEVEMDTVFTDPIPFT